MERTDVDKWSDRYFQLCLVLIGRQPQRCNIREVISRADFMLDYLKQRDEKFYADKENPQTNNTVR